MEYNTARSPMNIPEYGRNVQNMVDHCLSIEDREKRNRVARSIIDVIGNLNPHLRDVPDFKHKLWDHLFIMSDFKLDVDSPYPIPNAETFEEKPNKVNYPVKSRTFRHYGNVVKQMVKVALEMEDGPMREGLIIAIANQMKKSYLTWNKDTVEDAVIIKELNILANGKLPLEGLELSNNFPSLAGGNNKKDNGKNRRSNNKGKNKKNYRRNFKKN
jgi:hypothetical protein